jgi:radical SAM superfamily enzyme YgiQ (UPF0313 family)
MYKGQRFELRSVSDVKRDIDAVATICKDLRVISQENGHQNITPKAVLTLLNREPELNYHQGFDMVYHWLLAGGKTVFLQDANSLIMKTNQLIEILEYLRRAFPSIERVTTYARSKTLVKKSVKELVSIRAAGLDRLHVGLETGDDALLKFIRKGATAQNHIKGGQKALVAGYQLSEYWMPGLGGKSFWQNHAVNTAKVLNAINPHYIRSRPFRPIPGTGLDQKVQQGTFELSTPYEQLLELKLMIEKLNVTSRVCFDHVGNYWRDLSGQLIFSHDYEGYKFPEEKDRVLAAICEGLKVTDHVVFP